MADSPAEPAVTLRRRISELKKLLTENFYDGGGIKDPGESDDESYGDLKTIDDAIRVLTCLRKVESKIPESDNPSSSPVEVPKEFKCPISNDIMIKPVLISSGQTFEEIYITQYLKYEYTCPKTKEALSSGLWTPNHLVDELITQWCRLNNYDRPKPSDVIVYEMFPNDIDSLLKRISSPSSVQDQIEAARELRNQTKKFATVRYFFVTELDDSITRLLSPFSSITRLLSPFSAPGVEVDLNPELQENLFAALFNISIVDKNTTVIATNPIALPLLAAFLRYGTTETRRYCAGTLRSLALIAENRYTIAKSHALGALISVIKYGDCLTTLEACSAITNLCLVGPYMNEAISEGFINALTYAIREGINVAELLAYLRMLSTNSLAVDKMEDLDFIDYVFKILRKPSSSGIGDCALGIVYNMCNLPSDSDKISKRLELVNEEENKHATFSKITKQGSDYAVGIAHAILRWHKKCGTGKEPMRS